MTRYYIAALSMSLLFTAAQSLAAKSNSTSSLNSPSVQPNIIFILADDLGYGDLACYGNPIVKTPVLDQLAKNGIRLSQYHSAAPICAPSRVALLTGRYYERSGYRMTHDSRDSSLDEPWLMKQLRDNGYITGAFGKWHIGEKGFRERGCDEWTITSPGGWADFYDYPVLRNSEKQEKSDNVYVTDFLTDETIGFINRHAGNSNAKPFFIYLAYTAPHFPLQAPDEEIAPYRHKGLAAGTEIVYGMITRMDKNIGRILTELEKKGILDNTLIIFTSDNGPVLGSYKGLSEQRYNGDFAGQKEQVLEGGIRVPCITFWPKAFGETGQVFEYPMNGVDWAPTILAAAGLKPTGKPFDGISYLKAFKGESNAPAPARFWCYNKAYLTSISNAAMRDGDWKILRPNIESLNRWNNQKEVPPNPEPAVWQLFDLANDPGEKHNLANKYPERVMQMVKQFDIWWTDVLSDNEKLSGPAQPVNSAAEIKK